MKRMHPRLAQLSKERYDLVLASLVVSYVAASTDSRTVTAISGAIALGLIAAALSGEMSRHTSAAALVGVVVVAVVVIGETLVVGAEDSVVGPIIFAALMSGAALLIGRRMFTGLQALTAVSAAASIYLLIGFAFANVYLVTDRLADSPFLTSGDELTRESANYFSFVVLTTLGFGDLTPAGDGSRSLVTLEAIVGQFYLAIAVARLVASFGTVIGSPTAPVGGAGEEPR